jgi:hypothetical protein
MAKNYQRHTRTVLVVVKEFLCQNIKIEELVENVV